ncbi:MAG: class I SAM-dependent methyltransferase [Methanotrichaceae archaeon]|jgi:ubiquinone/menaquinone biosynthesis C-methylase UbiE
MVERLMITTQEDHRAKNVHPEYYDAAAAQIQPRPFPSPVNDPQWLSSAVDWFSQAETIMEVGSGRGEFAEALVRKGGPKRYYLVDMSQGMLDLVRDRAGKLSKNLELVFVHADIDSDPLNQIPDNSLDKIIMINAFQDVNPYSALKTFRRIISPKGFFRVNVLSREFRDENYRDEENFNKETGYFYLTRSHFADVKPLGYFTDKKGDRIPYYRILKSYYRKDLDRVFKECGFEILSAEPILLSKEVLLRAKTMAWNKSALRQEILSKYGGYPASIDVIARPI